MSEKNEFYTLRGYHLKNKNKLTESMEDYLEMIYRIFIEEKKIHSSDLAVNLHVRPSSVSKMMHKLKELELVTFEKYGNIILTTLGIEMGSYLLWRHNTLVDFFEFLNGDDYQLEQVEKIEHFIDDKTLTHMAILLNENTNNPK